MSYQSLKRSDERFSTLASHLNAVVLRGDLQEIQSEIDGLKENRRPLIEMMVFTAYNAISPNFQIIKFLADLAGFHVTKSASGVISLSKK